MLNQSNLTSDQAIQFNKINFKNKKKVEKLLENIFLTTNMNPKWNLTPIFSRDYFQSDLLRDLNFLSLVDFYVKKKKYNTIKVENYLLKKIIQQRYKKINVINSNRFKQITCDLIKLFYSFIKVVLYSMFMLANKSKERANKFINKKIILVETFFSKNMYKKKFNERYHKDIYIKFSNRIKKNCYFFPINLSIFSIKGFLNYTKNEKIKFIHPLDFLKFKDYIRSIFLIPKLGNINSKRIFYDNFDVTKILKYHNISSYFNFSTFIADLNYSFLKRLNKKKISIELILDWYENQIIDKGLCLGKNHFFPKSILKGHMGYINDFKNIHYYTPSILEKKNKTLPDEILLISKKIYNKIYKKIKFLNFKFVPAMRNKKIFELKINRKKKLKTNVLIICSANLKENDFIFNLIEKIYQRINFDKFNFIIKLHPNTLINSTLKKKKKLTVTNKNFYDLLINSDIVISGGTTATIEAKILNKNIILIGNNQGITLNPLFDENKKINICFDEKTLLKYINKLAIKNNKTKINYKLLNSYFIKFNKKYFKNFYTRT
jgi:hypothetical protein